jgi:hypothetical protein
VIFHRFPHLQCVPCGIAHTDLPGLQARRGQRACVITYQQGLKLSKGLTARLRADGYRAEYLKGGMYAWRDLAGMVRISQGTVPDPVDGATLWVTRHRPNIDRIACPWLIRRFVDANARFLFVSRAEVAGVADRYGATPFDIKDVFGNHRHPRCTFDTMLDEFALHTPALDRLAQVISAADTTAHDLAPEAAGLLAVSVGLSRQFKGDQDQLVTGLPLYDALCRWARDGTGEGHDWPTGRMQ